MKEVVNIHDLIKALLDQEHAFPAKLLYHFSDLSPQDQKVLATAWLTIPLKRRQALLEDLVEFAENDPVLMYESVARIALDDADPGVQCSAIDLLFDTEDKKLIPIYLRMLKDLDRDDAVRAAVANALGPFVCLGEYEKLRPEVLKEIEDALLQATNEDKSDLVRRRALESMGYSSREEVVDLLRRAAVMDDELWVESAMFGMGRSADEQWAPTILENLDHENMAVRIQAVHAAGELALKKARRFLLKSLDQISDEILLRETVWALAEIGGEGVERKLEALLAAAEDDEEISFLEEALELLNFNESDGDLEMLSIPWEKNESDADEEDADEEFEEDDEEYADRSDFNLEEWERYVSDDDDETDDDEYSLGDFDADRFN